MTLRFINYFSHEMVHPVCVFTARRHGIPSASQVPLATAVTYALPCSSGSFNCIVRRPDLELPPLRRKFSLEVSYESLSQSIASHNGTIQASRLLPNGKCRPVPAKIFLDHYKYIFPIVLLDDWT